MVKGSFGKNARKRAADASERKKRELLFRQDGQEYAVASKMLGNSRVEVTCADGKTRLCKISGRMRKRAWVGVGDLLLVGLRDFQDVKCDSIALYNATEASLLRRYGELEGLQVPGDIDEQEDGVVFEQSLEDINIDAI